jgi:inner membrane protein
VTAWVDAAILPKELKIVGTIAPEKRARGIYSVLVYANDLKLTGSFTRPDLSKLDYRFTRDDWSKARILVGLSDTKAFRGVSSLKLGQKEFLFVPGTNSSLLIRKGFSAAADLSGDAGDVPFSFEMRFAGIDRFMAAPLAEKTDMELTSSWPHPSFVGNGLPTERQILDDGFTAKWSVPNLVRNYPQAFVANEASTLGFLDDDNRQDSNRKNSSFLEEYLIGVDLVEPVALYSLVTRAAKYGIMFIGLTFLSFFLYELAARESTKGYRLHLGQYAIVGVALSLFYLVLLALAEHVGFARSYGVASALNISLISVYAAVTTRRPTAALVMGLVLAALYGILYVILNEEDLALAGGTALLVVALAAMMVATRNLAKNQARLSPGEPAAPAAPGDSRGLGSPGPGPIAPNGPAAS